MTADRDALDQIQELWGKLDRAGRTAHRRWLDARCDTCGRLGVWDGKAGGHPWHVYCDDCCDEGERLSQNGGHK